MALNNVTEDHSLMSDKLCHPYRVITIEGFLYCHISFLAIRSNFIMDQRIDLPHMHGRHREDPWT
jgi:hypothetical protein